MTKNNLYLENILLYSLILIPPFLITGPLIPEILMNLSNIIFLYLVISKKDYPYLYNKYSLFFLIFYLYINFNSLFSENIFISLKSSLFYFRFYLMSLSIWYILENKKQFKSIFFYSFLFFQTLLVVDGLYQFIFNENILGWSKPHPDRISSFFGDEMIMGSYLIKFLPLLVSLFILNFIEIKNNKYIFYLIFILTLIYTGITISGERSAFFLGLVFFVFVFSFIKLKHYRKIFLILSISLICTLLISIFKSEALKKRIINSTINSVIVFDSENKIEDLSIFSHNHETHIKTSINIFKDNLLIGVGLKQYRVKCKDEKYYINRHSCVTHPHHTYSQFLAELGIIGTLILLYFNIYLLFKIIKTKFNHSNFKYSYVNFFILAGLFLSIFPLVPSGNFFNNWLSIVFYLPLGFHFYAESKVNN